MLRLLLKLARGACCGWCVKCHRPVYAHELYYPLDGDDLKVHKRCDR